MDTRARIRVTGIVQGVGFRPYVYRLARGLGLKGFVLNTSSGVLIEVEGEGASSFADTLRQSPPPLAVIKDVKSEELPPAGYEGFEVRLSEPDYEGFSLVSPDIATCPDCLKEMCDPKDRRYLYPFTNCTNCGPRYSIVLGVPYDRPLTTMSGFTMCPDCKAEYDDPSDRRFHSQPTACPKCGPSIKYADTKGMDALSEAVSALKEGKIVAIKGLGGFHLACDAANDGAVKKLRQNKRKSRKPFGLMAGDIETVRKYCHVSEAEEALLTGRVRPIVLMRRSMDAVALSPDVAPGSDTLGFMLPYTPLHHLLFNCPGRTGLDVLVMTSGNLSEEPIVTVNAEAIERLSPLADSFLLHDRDIYMRVDDSVARVAGGVPRLVRRARGYAPEPFDMGRELPETLGCGAELKNTLCISRGRYAVMSQHIGDLANYESLVFFEETLENLKRTFGFEPMAIAHDLHPDYLSTRFAKGYVRGDGSRPKLVAVQHHHAHIAACMAENGYKEKVIGVAFDGTGYGTDENIWGGEFLLADFKGFERAGHLNYIPLPGGDMAVREPWRTAMSCLIQAYGPEAAGLFRRLKGGDAGGRDIDTVAQMVKKGINSPFSSGMGRLFDAVSSLIGIMDETTFEGEAAIALEAAAYAAGSLVQTTGLYPYGVDDGPPAVIDTRPLIRAVVDDVLEGRSKCAVAARFHLTVAEMVFCMCSRLREISGIETAALSGGVFQTALLSGLVEKGLLARGFRVLYHSKVPPNDGCISLGQVVVATGVPGD